MIKVLEKKAVCSSCALKNERLELILKGLMSELQCQSLFVTLDDYFEELTVLTGSTNMCNEMECFCDCE